MNLSVCDFYFYACPCLVLLKKMFPLRSPDWCAAESIVLVIVIRHRLGIFGGISRIIKHRFADAFYCNPMNSSVTIHIHTDAMRIDIFSLKESGNLDRVYNIFQFNEPLFVVIPMFSDAPESVANFWLHAFHKSLSYLVVLVGKTSYTLTYSIPGL